MEISGSPDGVPSSAHSRRWADMSEGSTRATLRPLALARAVRPERWTYTSAERGSW